jgi:hypothetical protein
LVGADNAAPLKKDERHHGGGDQGQSDPIHAPTLATGPGPGKRER